LKSFQFKIDLASLVPLELPALFYLAEYHTECRFNRLLKIGRLFECRLKIETRISYLFLFRIIYLVILLIVIIHWNSCFYFGISKLIGIGTDSWVFKLDMTNSTYVLAYEYVSCFYWSTLVLTAIGEVESPESSIESLVMIMNFLTAIVLVATLVGNISSVISNMSIEQDTFKAKVDAIKSLMKLRKVSKELDRRVIKWFDYLHKECQTLDEQELFASLPEKLSTEIATCAHMQRLKQISIFADCEEGLLKELVTKLKMQVYSPGDYVCRKGDIGKEMYIIKKGFLEVVSDDGVKVFVRLKPCAFFGEISILNIHGNKNGNRRRLNVRSVGYSELLQLTKTDLWNSLVDYTANTNQIIEMGKEKLRKDGLLEEETNVTQEIVLQIEDDDETEDSEIRNFRRLTVPERLQIVENSYEGINKRLDEMLTELNEKSTLLKERCARIKEIYDKKIGLPV
jgi:CRP-like cAMP-binding protein